MGVLQLIQRLFNPFQNYIFDVLRFVFNVVTWPARTVKASLLFTVDFMLTQTKTVIQKTLFAWTLLVILIGISFLMYAVFFTAYVPTAEIARPVHLAFSVCSSGVGICSFPSANVSFWNDEGTVREVLGSGQPYTVVLELTMPDSHANRNLGMFMVVIKMYDREGQVSIMSQRSTVFKYRSIIMRVVDVIMLWPLYLVGLLEQQRVMTVELFSHFVDDYYHPSVGATVEVHSHAIEIYSATLKLFAKFTGLKYFLYYWPITSAVCAVWINLMILLTGLAIVVYQRNQTLRKMTKTLEYDEDISGDKLTESESGSKDDGETSLMQTSTDEKDSHEQSTQTKSSEDDDPELYDLPLLQEPADFAAPEGDDDMVTELRQRRLH